MDTSTSEFVRAGSLEELKAKGRLVVHGRHRPILLVHEDGHVVALDNPSSAIWRSPLVTNPIIGAVGRVARATRPMPWRSGV